MIVKKDLVKNIRRITKMNNILNKIICFFVGHNFFEFNPDENYKACKRCGWVKKYRNKFKMNRIKMFLKAFLTLKSN